MTDIVGVFERDRQSDRPIQTYRDRQIETDRLRQTGRQTYQDRPAPTAQVAISHTSNQPVSSWGATDSEAV